jgi:hypothetical protein
MDKGKDMIEAIAGAEDPAVIFMDEFPLVFSEESYEVSTAAEFWLRAVFHLGKQ